MLQWVVTKARTGRGATSPWSSNIEAGGFTATNAAQASSLPLGEAGPRRRGHARHLARKTRRARRRIRWAASEKGTGYQIPSRVAGYAERTLSLPDCRAPTLLVSGAGQAVSVRPEPAGQRSPAAGDMPPARTAGREDAPKDPPPHPHRGTQTDLERQTSTNLHGTTTAGRSRPATCPGRRRSSEPGSGASAATCPSANTTRARDWWRKWTVASNRLVPK